MKRVLCLLIIVLLLIPGVLGADEVHLHSGGVIRGTIVEETDEGVRVKTALGETFVRHEDIKRIVHNKTNEQLVESRLATLKDDDVDGRVELARFANAREMTTRAVEILKEGLSIDPDHEAATELLRKILDPPAKALSNRRLSIEGRSQGQGHPIHRRMERARDSVQLEKKIRGKSDGRRAEGGGLSNSSTFLRRAVLSSQPR